MDAIDGRLYRQIVCHLREGSAGITPNLCAWDLAGGAVERRVRTWEKQVLSARGFKRVERHSEYSVYAVTRYGGA